MGAVFEKISVLALRKQFRNYLLAAVGIGAVLCLLTPGTGETPSNIELLLKKRDSVEQEIKDLNTMLGRSLKSLITLESAISGKRPYLEGQDKHLLEALNEEVFKIKSTYLQASKIYGPKHPKMRAIQARLKAAKDLLAARKKEIAWKLKSKIARVKKERIRIKKELDLRRKAVSRINDRIEAVNPALTGREDMRADAASGAMLLVLVFALWAVMQIKRRIVSRFAFNMKESTARRLGIKTVAVIPGFPRMPETALLPEPHNQSLALPFNYGRAGRESAPGGPGAAEIDQSQLSAFVKEEFFSIGASLIGREAKGSCSKVLITSARRFEGKSFIACNLAAALSKSGRRVLIIDGDLRNPVIGGFFGFSPYTSGLSDILCGVVPVEEGISSTAVDLLDVVPAGTPVDCPVQYLLSRRLRSVFECAEKIYDFVVVDTPPVLGVCDTGVFSRFVNESYLVSESCSPGRETSMAVEKLRGYGTTVLGVILNKTEMWNTDFNRFKDVCLGGSERIVGL